MPKVETRWRKRARTDLLTIISYIAADNPQAAQTLMREIERKVDSLVAHPKLYRPGRVEGTREMVVRPNYIVVYRENSGSVTILRVLHAARHWPPATVCPAEPKVD